MKMYEKLRKKKVAVSVAACFTLPAGALPLHGVDLPEPIVREPNELPIVVAFPTFLVDKKDS